MSKALRLSEKWYRRGLWGVALLLAWFLIGLGGTLVGDLPKVEKVLVIEDFLDAAHFADLKQQLEQTQAELTTTDEQYEQARLAYTQARQQTVLLKNSYQHWLSTRSATQDASQDLEVLRRTQELDGRVALEQQLLAKRDVIQQQLLDLRQNQARLNRDMTDMRKAASESLALENRSLELRVFLYRLLLTLPLLLLAFWLLKNKRKGPYWPFVWGFAFFALFAFFVELVPYLPSYGGYVRYGVGVALTLLGGRWVIVALNRYLARQQQAETLPEQERRNSLGYDEALSKLSKGVCPGCERRVNLTDGATDFCPHCGIGLFVYCVRCDARKSAFTHFCHACGANQQKTDVPAD